MSELKDTWVQTAKSFVLALNDLGVSLAVTAKAGVDAAVEWARKDNPHVQAEGREIPTEEAEESPAPAEAEQTAEAAE
jgi:hypothetical protein